jgi:peptide/nickel transport system substrate-binding protein
MKLCLYKETREMRNWSKTLAGALLAASISAGPVLAGKADDTLNVAFMAELTTLDNYKESGREGLILARLIYDSLISKDFATGQFKPELAESYTFVDDKTIDFKLRQGVKFHNGQTLTADDVVYTLNLVSSKEYNARFQIAVDWIEKAEKLGDHAVRIRMKAPNPLALEMLAGNLPIYPKAYYESVGTQGMGVKPIGTGPYRLVELTPGTRYVFERFDDYFEGSPKGKAQIKRLVVRVLPEVNTQYAELVNGRLDWIWRLPPDDARNLSRRGIEIRSAEIMRFAYISLNPKFDDGKSPLADVRVRRAINHAINREGIVKALVGGASKVIESACNPIQIGCATDVTKYEYSVAKAKALLAEAGYPNGFKTELLMSNIPRIQAEAIASDLGKVGIQATLNEQQYAPALTAYRENRAPLFLINWGSYGVGDVGLSTGVFFNGSGDDLVKDPELMPLLKDAAVSTDPKLRQENYSKALKRIADQAYWVPLWTYSVTTALSKDLELKLEPDEFVQFYKARWK